MQRAFIGWSSAALAALVLTAQAEAAPRTRDGGPGDSGGATAVARPAPSPPPASTPAPAPAASGSSGGGDSTPAVRAAQRGERRAPSGGGRATSRPRSGGGTASTASSEGRDGDDDRRAVGRQRPRGDRTTYATAVPRTRPHQTIPSWAWRRPSYWYGYNSVGLGYFYYDPYWWGYPGYHGYGYGAYGPGSYGPGYYGPGYGGYYVRDRHLGNVRLKVKPRDAEVRVDGYYVGVVDQYDGVFQRLTLESGPHRIEIAKEGFEPLVVDIRVLPYDTVTYKGELQPQ